MVQLASPYTLRLSLAAVVLLTVIGAFLDLRQPERGPYDAHWERIQQQGFLVVGTDPTLPPFSIYTDDGPIGLEPDIIREIGKRMGLEVRFILLGYDGTYDSLLNPGGTDLVISTLRPDPFRMDRIRYSSPYFDAGHVLVSPEGYTSLEALAGKTLAVEFASEGDITARQVKNLTIQRYFTAQEGVEAVYSGEADAALVDHVSALYYADKQWGLTAI
ncbi:MAG: transporter substrate-binding domain-containing protein, partial [Anaerolineae bacterium]|nr:transporter substrate-binding domain-containing protein [Anaerolineae bacterium]